MSDAASLIRSSIAALPTVARQSWHLAANPHVALWSERAQEAIRAHAVLLASPDVAAALADLLDAIREYRPNYDATIFDIEAKRDALEAAVTRTGGKS